MNLDNKRLKEIREFKTFYHNRLKEATTELEHDLLQIQIDKLDNEEKQILRRCDVYVS